MPDVQTLFYHGMRQQIRRVLGKMSEDQIDAGLTAFEDGASSWSSCFFARALAPAALYGERDVMRILDLNTPVPVRVVYMLFDQLDGSMMTTVELRQFISDVRDESRPAEVNHLLRSLNFSAEKQEKEVVFNGVECA